MPPSIRVIHPASKGPLDVLQVNLADLAAQGFHILWQEPQSGPAENRWPYTSAPMAARLQELSEALCENESQIILCARGGYGMSDLLPFLPWQQLQQSPPKLVIGFSDISSLLSALWTQLKWPGVHGPMPGSDLWGKNSQADLALLYELMHSPLKKGHLKLEELGPKGTPHPHSKITGWIFGGCFSVLTNLIATPYFPSSLEGSILFLEDTGENPARLMRYWNQWLQSGVLTGVKAVILGHFRELSSPLSEDDVKLEFARRCSIPVWSARELGHLSPNFPLILGAQASLDPFTSSLLWTLTANEEPSFNRT